MPTQSLPYRMELKLHKQATYTRKLVWTNASDGTPALDLVDFDAKMVVKAVAPNKGPDIVLTHLDGLTLNAIEGSVTIEIEPDKMANCIAYPDQAPRYGKYDLLLISKTLGGPIHILLEGEVVLVPGVTTV